MVSKKQLAANRRNAQKSTGPRSPQGKSISRLNSIRHGLRSRASTLPAESWHDLLETRDRFLQVWQPQTPAHHRLVAEIACAEWKLLQWRDTHAHALRQAAENLSPRRLDRLRASFYRRERRLEHEIEKAYRQVQEYTPAA